MIKKIVSLLSPYIPVGLAIKGMSKISPQLSSFIASAATAGYGTDTIIDFLRDQFESPAHKGRKAQLENKESQGGLRPDQVGSLNKYRGEERLQKTAATGAGLLAGGIGAALAGRGKKEDVVNPEVLPAENTQQQPQLGYQQQKLLPSPETAGQGMGRQVPQGQVNAGFQRGSTKNQYSINPQQQITPSAQLDRNILSQYSPELQQFVEQQLGNGRSTLDAGAIAQLKFPKQVNKLQADLKQNFSKILESIYGDSQQGSSSQPQQQPQLQNPPHQPGQGAQALMQIMQQINQKLGSK